MLWTLLACAPVQVEHASSLLLEPDPPALTAQGGASPGSLVVRHQEDLVLGCCPSVDLQATLLGDTLWLDPTFGADLCQCVGGPSGYQATLVGLPSGAELRVVSGALDAQATVP